MVTRKERSRSQRSDVIRTRKAIEDAYHSLLFSKPFNKITVTDVINEANISRGTFYAYFSDIKDLGDCVEEQIINRLKTLVEGAADSNLMENLRPMVKVIASDMEMYRDRLRILFEKNDGARLHEKLKSRLKECLTEEFTNIRQPERKILVSCILASVLDTCVDWVINEDSCDIEILVDSITGFMSEGVEYFNKG
ncbi:MAG: TetR/AcrR family transcriptional regulator [Lachnospiraceae bacterium]|nr:TetR/AcrR family transcriptional regulator [Lachnospiraceae bacterium]